MNALENMILARKARIGIIGLGYVGLPLAIGFSESGFSVFGVDTDKRKVEALRRGESYVLDVRPEAVAAAVRQGRFTASTEFDHLQDVDAVSICVPTPLRKTKDPDVSYIVAAVSELKKHLHRPMLVVLESTTYPGTTEELVQAEVEKAGFRVGTDIYLCFSPERVDPGNPKYHTKNTPKVIGGVTPECTRMGTLLYSQVVEKVIPVSSARAAEMVKLLENTFRAVNIALVNEMALMCERMGIDIWEVIDAAATKPFGFMPFYPGPGIGGHCIPLDPMYLSWKAKMYNFYNRFIELASDINGNMPYHVVQRIAEVLNLAGRPISESTVLCLGIAYKRDVSDTRESPSLDVMRLLRRWGARVQYSDPYVPVYREDGFQAESVALTPETIKEADCVVLLTDHSRFDYQLIAQHARRIVDTRNAFRGVGQNNVFRIGTPLPTAEEWRQMNETTEQAAATTEGSRGLSPSCTLG